MVFFMPESDEQYEIILAYSIQVYPCNDKNLIITMKYIFLLQTICDQGSQMMKYITLTHCDDSICYSANLE